MTTTTTTTSDVQGSTPVEFHTPRLFQENVPQTNNKKADKWFKKMMWFAISCKKGKESCPICFATYTESYQYTCFGEDSKDTYKDPIAFEFSEYEILVEAREGVSCPHHVCGACMEKMVEMCINESDSFEISCPMCRCKYELTKDYIEYYYRSISTPDEDEEEKE